MAERGIKGTPKGSNQGASADEIEASDVVHHVAGYIRWLEGKGYRPHTIWCHQHYLPQFLEWAEVEHVSVTAMVPVAVERFCVALKEQQRLRGSGDRLVPAVFAARRFVEYLVAAGVAAEQAPATASPPKVLADFERWMREHRGVRESTLTIYRRVLKELIAVLGEEPDKYGARELRGFVLWRSTSWGRSRAKMDVTAARMFLRYLAVTGRCSADLVDSLPTIAHWHLSALPRHLDPADLERVVDATKPTSEQGARDRAVVLLLARLGLRSGDVAGLRLGDIDWQGGRLLVSGKGRRQVWMPLSQEVGDALELYLESFRPRLDDDLVFITVQAPRRAISSQNCKHIVDRAVQRADVTAPCGGAHLLRHSAATSMLAQGLPLEAIGAVLRHRSTRTTEHYTKVDRKLLEAVALPWPEVAPC
jgi:site-specific recombinase XerD